MEDEKKGFNRWTILIAVLIAIAAGLGFCSQRGGEQALPTAPPRAATEAAPEPEAPAAKPAPAPEPVAVTVLFEFDRAVLRLAETAKLDALAERLRGGARVELDAVGHADRIGTTTYNQRLAAQRAEAVKAYLAGKGLAVQAASRGEAEPVTGGRCADLGPESGKNRALVECLQPNRRAEIAPSGAR